MKFDKEKYRLDLKEILSDLKIEIPKGYIEVNSAKTHTKKDSSNKKSKQKR